MDVKEQFVKITKGRVRFDEPMRAHTTFHIGGPAEIWAEPRTVKELKSLVLLAKESELPLTIIGGGANLLVTDAGIPGLVIHLGNSYFQCYERDKNTVLVGAGLPLEWLIRRSLEASLSGVEFLAGVPGRVGGAVRMNAGTHDLQGDIHSFFDVVESVTIMNDEGRIAALPREKVGFGYRSSALTGMIILSARLALSPDDNETIDHRVKELWEFKKRTQDWKFPSAGCIFKNPSNGPAAGWLVDQVGLKGYQQGGAAISSVHGNFMMNCGQATATDVLALIEEVRTRVKKKFDVDLQLEVQLLGTLK